MSVLERKVSPTRNPCHIDCHLHTVYSGHGEGSVAEIAAKAYAQGLSAIAFTEHLILPEGADPDYSFSMNKESLANYKTDVFEAREQFSDMDIVYGGEADWLGDENFLLEYASGYDYLLGSVHFIDGWAFDNPAELPEWDRRDVDGIWLRYFELWRDAVKSSVPFDCMAHPDLPKKFGRYPSFDLREMYDEMARLVSDAGIAIEVNTAGSRKPVGEQYPSFALLKAFCEHDVACSIGSDAHCQNDVFKGVPEALDLMAKVGYAHLMVPISGGGKRFVPIGRSL